MSLPGMNCRRLVVLVVSIVGLFATNGVDGAEPDYMSHGSTVKDSVLDLKDIIGWSFTPNEDHAGDPLHELPETLDPFFRDTSVKLKPRTYYRDNQVDGAQDSEAWAIGGALEYRSGRWLDRLAVGATVHTTQRLYGPDDKSGSGLLKPVQQGFTVLSEAFLDLRVSEQAQMQLFRQRLKLPYVNDEDNRMVPNTFETYRLFDEKDAKFNYVLGHVTRIKERDSDDFIHLSEAAGADGADKGLTMIGARYSFGKNATVGAINQYSWDVFNTLFLEANGAWTISDDLAIRFSGQFTDQRSVGDELTGSFDTNQASVKTAASFGGAILSFAYSRNDDGADIMHPYGDPPGYTALINKKFTRAGEDAWLVGASYVFDRIGFKGWSGFVNFAKGDTPDSGAAATPDQDELDITLDFRPRTGFFQGVWVRARASIVDQHGAGAEDINDYRIIVNYTVPLL